MKKQHLYTVILFAAFIIFSPQSVVYKCFEDTSHAKITAFSYLKTKDASSSNLAQRATPKQELILAFSESKLVFNSSNDNNNDFLSPNNKECFNNHSLNNYISKMRSTSCNVRSLSELNVLRI
ncbi:MAG: hypothetical protein LBR17_08060 [Bacteroidales bacterium]|jgi:hypothetical protein|nr:hypothetical protein [Bacteroidales bacterium]